MATKFLFQIEYNPYFAPEKLKKFCDQKGMAVMGYSPFTRENIKQLFSEPIINELSEKYGKTPAQVTLRFLVSNNHSNQFFVIFQS